MLCIWPCCTLKRCKTADVGLKVQSMAAQLLGSGLSRVMLQAIECAVEFWLALEWSPQAQWLLEASETGPLQEEVWP